MGPPLWVVIRVWVSHRVLGDIRYIYYVRFLLRNIAESVSNLVTLVSVLWRVKPPGPMVVDLSNIFLTSVCP